MLLCASVLPVQLDCLPFPELPLIFPLLGFGSRHLIPSGMSFPHLLKSFLFKVPALMPAPPGSLHLLEAPSGSACTPFPDCHCPGVRRVVSLARL